MKKIFCVFAAMLMLLSVASIAFAQEVNQSVSDGTDGLNETVPADDVISDNNSSNASDANDVLGEGSDDGSSDSGDQEELDDSVDDTEDEDSGLEDTGNETVGNETVDQEGADETDNSGDGEIITDEDKAEAGITPDQPVLYGLERALERVSLALTFGKSAKAQMGLAHAQERLMEVKVMIQEKKMAQAEKAEKLHKKAIEDVQTAVDEMDGVNPEQQLADQVDIEEKLQKQEQEMEQIKVKAKEKLNLSEEQKAQLDELVSSLKESVGSAKAKVEVKKNKIKVKVQAKTGKTAQEVDEIENQVKDRVISRISKKKADVRAKLSGDSESEDSSEDSGTEVSDASDSPKPGKGKK